MPLTIMLVIILVAIAELSILAFAIQIGARSLNTDRKDLFYCYLSAAVILALAIVSDLMGTPILLLPGLFIAAFFVAAFVVTDYLTGMLVTGIALILNAVSALVVGLLLWILLTVGDMLFGFGAMKYLHEVFVSPPSLADIAYQICECDGDQTCVETRFFDLTQEMVLMGMSDKTTAMEAQQYFALAIRCVAGERITKKQFEELGSKSDNSLILRVYDNIKAREDAMHGGMIDELELHNTFDLNSLQQAPKREPIQPIMPENQGKAEPRKVPTFKKIEPADAKSYIGQQAKMTNKKGKLVEGVLIDADDKELVIEQQVYAGSVSYFELLANVQELEVFD